MKRKVNLVGMNTHTVSLPSKWVKDHKIKKGEEVNIECDSKDNLIISAGTKTENNKKQITLDISKEEIVHIRSLLGSIYRKGYDIAYLKYPSSEVYKKIVEACGSLIGYEIIEFGQNKCTIKNMIIEESSEFEGTLKRMIHATKWLNSLLIDNITDKKYENYEDFNNMRLSAWKLRDYALRIVAKKNLYGEDNINYSIIAWTLEKIIDNYRKIYDAILKDNKKDYSQVIPILKKYDEMIDNFDKAYTKKDIKETAKIEEKYTEINKLCLEAFKGNNKYNNLIIAYIKESNKRLQDLKSFVVMIVLDSSEDILNP